MNNDKKASYSCIHGESKDTSQLQFILKLILPSLWKTGTIFHPGWWVDDKGIPDVSGIRIKNINLLISACSVLFWGQHKEKKTTRTRRQKQPELVVSCFSFSVKTWKHQLFHFLDPAGLMSRGEKKISVHWWKGVGCNYSIFICVFY